MRILRQLLKKEQPPTRGLLLLEWAMAGYALLTTIFIVCAYAQLHHPAQLLLLRAEAVVMTAALWAVNRWLPCRLTLFLRVAGQMVFLSWWYPDTFELNRIFPNLDHVFASWEQALFGFQPALVLSRQYAWPLLSELLSLGYVSYYPMMLAVMLFYLISRHEQFLRTSFIIMTSFFLFYVIFICLPVAGPQFYYQAVGTDQIAQGIFPALGDYFNRLDFDVHNHALSLPIPGWEEGLFHRLLMNAHDAGERPTAAFPSSHVGITMVLMWLAWKARSRWLFLLLLPLAVLMFFATFYIQAHYAIDALAGLVAGTAIYILTDRMYTSLSGACPCVPRPR